MIQLRDPCKRCIVRPACREKCKAKLKYYKDRLSPIPYTIVCLLEVIIYAAIWVNYPSIKNHPIFYPACTTFMFLFGLGMVYKFMYRDTKDQYSDRWKYCGL